MLLYRQSYPTTALVLASDTHTLTFRKPTSSGSSTASSSSPQIELSFESISTFDVVGCTLVRNVHGSLGLVQLAGEIFLCVITSSVSLTSRYVTQEHVSRIMAVEFFSISSAAWDDLHSLNVDGTSTPPTPHGIDGYNMDQQLGAGGQPVEHPASAMKKILSNGHFYFSSGDYDVSTRLEERVRKKAQGDDTAYDSRFVWNGFLMDSILDFRDGLSESERAIFDASAFIVSVIQGFVGVSDFTLSGYPITISLISRLGFARAGTRFNTRGIDDDGNVANFVETETIMRTKDAVFSFVQIRGSVPLFWEQQGTTPFGGQRLQITRPPIASQPAFNKHFSALLANYPKIEVVNLLSSKDHEAMLSLAYFQHIRSANAQLFTSDEKGDSGQGRNIEYAEFDFHKEARVAGGIESVRDLIRRDRNLGGKLEDFGYCLLGTGEKSEVPSLIHTQEGVFRTNCLDCLDRTNVVQDILSLLALSAYLPNLNPNWSSSDILLTAHRTLWAENGDSLSKIYAGTGALNTSFTRSGKRTLAGALSDATKSVSRMYISNFTDKGKQMAIDALLGNLTGQQKVVVVDPVRDTVDSALQHRISEYSSTRNYIVFTGTFNVNGKTPGTESLLPWLFPDPNVEPDVIALGFQELVELSPQQIMATDPEKLRRWQNYILSAISSRPNAKEDYVLLRGEQLVGTALIMLLKSSVAGRVRNVEAAAKKTGLKGMAGNKGAVGIRLDLDDSTLCFVTAHYAAGHSAYEQRNLDYATIANGLHFKRGKKIQQHEKVIYFGDLNYRIAMPNDVVREMAVGDDYASLIEGDQLTNNMRSQAVFSGYSEGPLIFRPTYKYDNQSETYDTSEKQRIPSWTDRILYKGEGLDLTRYNRAELLMSDHRPVYALFRATVNVIDQEKRARIKEEMRNTLSPERAAKKASSNGATTVARKLFDEDADILPEASSNLQNWWSDLDLAVIKQSLMDTHRNGESNPFDAEDTLTSSNVIAPPLREKSFGVAGKRWPPVGEAKPAPVEKSMSIKRKPPPPVPGNKPTLPSKPSQSSLDQKLSTGNGQLAVFDPAYKNHPPSIKPPLNRKTSNASLLDESDDEQKDSPTAQNGQHEANRPGNKREATQEWQVIAPALRRQES